MPVIWVMQIEGLYLSHKILTDSDGRNECKLLLPVIIIPIWLFQSIKSYLVVNRVLFASSELIWKNFLTDLFLSRI